MRGLKALVIVMGVLIVAGLAVVVVTIAHRATERRGDAPGFADARVPIPDGAEVVETVAADGRLLVRLRLADGTPRILVIDVASGRRIGAIDLPAAPAAP